MISAPLKVQSVYINAVILCRYISIKKIKQGGFLYEPYVIEMVNLHMFFLSHSFRYTPLPSSPHAIHPREKLYFGIIFTYNKWDITVIMNMAGIQSVS